MIVDFSPTCVAIPRLLCVTVKAAAAACPRAPANVPSPNVKKSTVVAVKFSSKEGHSRRRAEYRAIQIQLPDIRSMGAVAADITRANIMAVAAMAVVMGMDEAGMTNLGAAIDEMDTAEQEEAPVEVAIDGITSAMAMVDAGTAVCR